MWKVYKIETGRALKAGFKDEDAAKDWLVSREDLLSDDYEVEEMDPDEEEEFRLAVEAGDEDDDVLVEDEAEADDDDVDFGDDQDFSGVEGEDLEEEYNEDDEEDDA